jgi:hypothetical protein
MSHSRHAVYYQVNAQKMMTAFQMVSEGSKSDLSFIF